MAGAQGAVRSVAGAVELRRRRTAEDGVVGDVNGGPERATLRRAWGGPFRAAVTAPQYARASPRTPPSCRRARSRSSPSAVLARRARTDRDLSAARRLPAAYP